MDDDMDDNMDPVDIGHRGRCIIQHTGRLLKPPPTLTPNTAIGEAPYQEMLPHSLSIPVTLHFHIIFGTRRLATTDSLNNKL